jgi:PAS domain S-box-containing protein
MAEKQRLSWLEMMKEHEQQRSPARGPLSYEEGIESMSKFSGMADDKGVLLFANENTVRDFGYDAEEILRKPFWQAQWFSPSKESQRKIMEGMLEAMEGREAECQVEVFPNGGDGLPITFSLRPLAGRKRGTISIVALTESVDAEQGDLDEDKEVVSEDSLVGGPSLSELDQEVSFETDEADRLVAISPSMAKFLNYQSADNLMGLRAAELWANTEDRDRFLMELSRRTELEGYEARFLTKDGQEVSVALDIHLILDPEGEVTGSKAVVRRQDDVPQGLVSQSADEEEVEVVVEEGAVPPIDGEDHAERLGELEEQFLNFAELTRDAVAIVQEGMIVFANANLAQLLGLDRDGLAGSEFVRHVSQPLDEAGGRKRKGKRSQKKVTLPKELQLINAAGESVPVEHSSRPIRYHGGPAELMVLYKTGVTSDVEDTLYEEELQKITLDATADGILVVDTEGNILLTNDQFVHMWNMPEALLEGEEDQGMISHLLDQLLEPDAFRSKFEQLHGSNEEYVDAFAFEDGRFFEHFSRPLLKEGIVTGRVWSFRDVTERKRAEQELRASQERLEEIFVNATDEIIITDTAGKIVSMNHDLCGYAPEDYIGRTMPEIDVLDPQEALRLSGFVVESLANGGRNFFETELKHKRGHRVPVEVAASAIISNDGLHQGFISIVRDITERREAQADLGESEERFRALIENSSEGITIMSADGTVQYMSPSIERIMGYEARELIGRSGFEFLHPEEQKTAMESLTSLLKEPRTLTTGVYRFRRRDGSWRTVEMTGKNLLDDPAVNGIVVNSRDITEHVKAEAKLRQYQEQLKEALEKVKGSYEEASIPVIQVWDRVLAIPLVGVVDSARAMKVMDHLLSRIVEARAEVIIMDVTGVAALDTQVANHLLQTAHSTELLGAECVITGISPDVAQSVIRLGMDITQLVTKRDLQGSQLASS